MAKRLLGFLTALILLIGGCSAMGEFVKEDWYQEALKGCEMSLGNNLRLKKLIERAQNGEMITVATIGGSITEGAGATTYPECWASRFAKRFGGTYGVNNGANVEFVNAGVGGTASPFGYMRYGREITARVSENDPDGYADLVVVEYSVNDWQEPTGHRCYESMVKEILEQPNEPVVILLFAVFKNGWNLEEELRKIGDRYDLMMVSIRDGIYPHLDKEFPIADWFSDEYHPKSVGHRMMADALMLAVADAYAADTAAADVDLSVKAVYGTDFMGLKTIFGEGEVEGFTVERGGFDRSDAGAYSNRPVGQVCGKNFYHDLPCSNEPLKVTGVFRKCLVAWKATTDSSYGTAEILIDGEVKMTLSGKSGNWGQSEVVMVLNDKEPVEHTPEIRVREDRKRFVITAIGVQ